MKLSQLLQASSLVITVATSSLATLAIPALANSLNTSSRVELNRFQQKKNDQIAQFPNPNPFTPSTSTAIPTSTTIIPSTIVPIYLTGTTNSNGGLYATYNVCGTVVGMSAAVQSTFDGSLTTSSGYRWDATTISTSFTGKYFSNAPVRIILFVNKPSSGC